MVFKRFTVFLLFLILVFSISLAQEGKREVVTTFERGISIEDLISSIIALSFLGAFILILLMLGGIGRPRVGIPWTLILFTVLIVILFITPQFVEYPQYVDVPESFKKGGELPSMVSWVFISLGLPEEWMYVPAIIYLFLLPFAAIYTLVWAFLQSLGIFANVPSSVNRVLAFIVAFLTIPMNSFVRMVWVLFSFMGIFSVVIFVATFIIGIFFRGATAVYKEKAELEKYAQTTTRTYKNLIAKLEGIKKLPTEDQRRSELDKLIMEFGTELHLADAYQKAMEAKSQPTPEKIDELINTIKNKVRI